MARRRKVGWDLYGALGIQRSDQAAMQRQTARNYLFFDAPVGLIFTIDRQLKIGSWLYYGMFLQSIMIAARAHGLDTYAQQTFAKYHHAIRHQLDFPDTRLVVCGMALGYCNAAAAENSFVTARMDLTEFVDFRT